MNTGKTRLGIFAWFGLIITGFLLFQAGVNGSDRQFLAATGNIILAAFTFALTWLSVYEYIQRLKTEAYNEGVDNTSDRFVKDAKGKLDEIFAEAARISRPIVNGVQDKHDEMLTETLFQTVKEVAGNRIPTEEELAEVQKRFTDKTGHDVRLGFDKDKNLRVNINRNHKKDVPPTTTTTTKRTTRAKAKK